MLSADNISLDDVLKTLELLPSQTRRTAGMEKYQQFSTPPSIHRLNKLSDGYTEKCIRDRITGKREAPIRNAPAPNHPTQSLQSPKVNLLIDIQNSIKAQSNTGYERWAKIFNLKQAAQTLLFLQDNNLDDMGKLQFTAQQAKDDFNDIQNRIATADARLKEISILQRHIGSYIKTRDVYVGYRKAGYSKKYLTAHEAEITAHKAAKTFFNEQNLDKLPTMKMLKEEYATVLAEKKKAYSQHGKARKFMQDVLVAKQNAELILGYSPTQQAKENARMNQNAR